MLRLPVSLLFVALLAAPAAWAEETVAAPPVVAPAPPNVAPEPSPLPRDEANRLAEPEIPRSDPPELAVEDFSLGWTLLRTMIVLAIVVALAYLTLNIGLRRLLGIRAPLGTSVVTVLERVTLDQKRSLFVIEAGGEVLLIGGGDSGLSLISKLDRTVIDQARTQTSSPVQLSPFLRKLLGRKEPATPPPAPDLDGKS